MGKINGLSESWNDHLYFDVERFIKEELIDLFNRAQSMTQTLSAITVTSGASLAAQVYFPNEGKNLEVKMAEKTEKITININKSGSVFTYTLNGSLLNYQQLYQYLIDTNNLIIFMHGSKEYVCCYIETATNMPKYIMLISPEYYVDANVNYVKCTCLKIESSDGIAINRTIENIITNETISNKKQSLTGDTQPTISYPSVQAVNDGLNTKMNTDLSNITNTGKTAINSAAMGGEVGQKLGDLSAEVTRFPVSNNANLNSIIKELHIPNADISAITKVIIYHAVSMGGVWVTGLLMRDADNNNIIDTRVSDTNQQASAEEAKVLYSKPTVSAVIDWGKVEQGTMSVIDNLRINHTATDIDFSPTLKAISINNDTINVLSGKADKADLIDAMTAKTELRLTGSGADGFVNNEGKFESLASYTITAPFHLNAGDKLHFRCGCSNNGDFCCLSETKNVSDAVNRYHKVLILGKGDAVQSYDYVADHDMYCEITYIASQRVNDVYVINSNYNARIGVLEKPIEEKNASWMLAVKNILCIGDSLTDGAYFTTPSASSGITINENYPYYLGRILNTTVTNAGDSGKSASDWYANHISQYNYADYDTFIIWLGTNYAPTTDPTDNPSTDNSETGYYQRIIETILSANASCKIFMCSIFASKSSLTLAKRKIPLIAQKYGIPLIDMSDLSQVNYPELHNNVDNVHFGKAGNIFIASRISKYLQAYFAEDPMRCEFGMTQKSNINI